MRKHKITLLIFISFLFTSNIYSQWFEQILPVGGTMYDMVFFDANTGVISFDSRQVIRTTNGGVNWTIVFQGYVTTLKKVDDSAAFGHGPGNSNNLVYKTTNRGLTWDSAGGTALSVKDFYFANRDTGWFSAFGGPSGILKTTDGGVSIFPISSEAGFGIINFLKKRYNGEYFGWIVTQDYMKLTTNSGVNWYKPSNGLDSLNIGSVSFLNKDTGWVSGINNFNSGRVYFTSNSGIDWIKQYQEISNFPEDINFPNFNKGWGGREDTKIFATSNGGQVWGFQNIPIFRIRKVFMLDSLIGWCGTALEILHTTNGGGNIVKIKNENNEIPKEYTLRQNYPNPFNPTSIIEFSIKEKANVSLIIYDMQGREIMKLFENKELIPGDYKSLADFSSSGLSSGTYFYKLIILGKENIVITKKMSFIK